MRWRTDDVPQHHRARHVLRLRSLRPGRRGPYGECLKIGYGLGGSLVRILNAPPDHCPIRRERVRVFAGGVLQEAQEALNNGGQAWIDSLADIDVGD